MINFEAEHFKLEYGTAGLTFPCYQSSLNPRHVTRSKSIRTSDMVHAILWPSIGNFLYRMANFPNFLSKKISEDFATSMLMTGFRCWRQTWF